MNRSKRIRYLELEGCWNLREIGGYATTDGRITRWGQILRSDSLQGLSAEGQQQLLAYPLRSIIDLRHTTEIEGAPNVFAQAPEVIYHHIPLLDVRDEDWSKIDLWQVNKNLLDEQVGLKQVFTVLASKDTFPVLIHCTAGKDRTGLVIALLLGLLNVPAETIIEDYRLSAVYLQPQFEQLRQQAEAAGIDMAQFAHLLESPPELMRKVVLATYAIRRVNYSLPHQLLIC
jgi:protein-tyrosine phosphatase